MNTSATTQNPLHKPAKPLLLEHINLNIPNENLARQFYIDALGGVENPKTTNEKQLHVNVGSSQFHLLLKTKTNVTDNTVENVKVPQHWPGYIELWTNEDLEDVRKRLPYDRCFYLQQQKQSSPSSTQQQQDTEKSLEKQKLICICPWKKNYFLLKRAPQNYNVIHTHPGGFGTLVAMHRLVHPVSAIDDTIERLSKFWTNVMGCVTSIEERDDEGDCTGCDNDTYNSLLSVCNNGEQTNSNSHHGRRRCCIVHFESGQELILEQSANAPPYNSYDIQNDIFGYHLCFYLPTDTAFQFAFQQVEESNLLYANPRFAGGENPAFGNAMNWKEAVDCGQFRVKDWSWYDGGEEKKKVPSLVLELEVRSKKHICCPFK